MRDLDADGRRAVRETAAGPTWTILPRPRRRERLLARSLARSDVLYRLLNRLVGFARRLDRGVMVRADILRGSPVDVGDRGRLPEATQYWVARNVVAVRERIDGVSSFLQIAPVVGTPLARVGTPGDGGYVMIDDLVRSDFFVSLGVGGDVSWDSAVASIGSGVHLYDDSVDALPTPVPGSVFYRERVGATAGPSTVTITDCIGRAPSDCDLILKVDIEGSEWAALGAVVTSDLERCRQIVVEFHDVMWSVIDPGWHKTAIDTLAKLWATHQPIHVHANNFRNFQVLANVPVPDVIEVTYARRADYEFGAWAPFPGQDLTARNSRAFPEISLVFPVPMRQSS